MCLFKSKKQRVEIPFGVPYFDLCDARFPDFPVPVAVRGTLAVQIRNVRKFLKRQGYKQLSINDLQSKIKSCIVSQTKACLIELTQQHHVSIFQVETFSQEVSNILKQQIFKRIKKELNIIVEHIDILCIEIDKTSQGYQQLKSLTQDITFATIQAETKAKLQALSLPTSENPFPDNKKTRLLPFWIVGGVVLIAVVAIFFFT